MLFVWLFIYALPEHSNLLQFFFSLLCKSFVNVKWVSFVLFLFIHFNFDLSYIFCWLLLYFCNLLLILSCYFYFTEIVILCQIACTLLLFFFFCRNAWLLKSIFFGMSLNNKISSNKKYVYFHRSVSTLYNVNYLPLTKTNFLCAIIFYNSLIDCSAVFTQKLTFFFLSFAYQTSQWVPEVVLRFTAYSKENLI